MSCASLTIAVPASSLRASSSPRSFVPRPDRGLQPVRALVGEGHRLLGVGDAHHRQGRAERLLDHAAHRVIDPGQDRRLVEATRPGAALAAGDHLCPLVDRVGDVSLDQLDLGREDDRADVDRSRLPGRPLTQGRDLLGQLRQEVVVHGLLDVDPLDRDADLAGVVEPVGGRGVGRALEVGVREHDHRVLAAELEADRGEGLRRLRHHLLARRDGAGEHHVVDLVDQRRAGRPAPGGDGEDAVRDPALGQHLGHQQRGERGDLGWLEDDRVAGGKRRDAVAERVVERVVPRADHPDHAERRVAHDHPATADERRRRLDLLVGEVDGRLAGPELERREPVRELGDLGLVGRAPGLRADRADDALRVGDHPAAGGEQDLGAPVEAERGPAGLRGARGGDQRAHLIGPEFGDGRDRLPGRRVLDRDPPVRGVRACVACALGGTRLGHRRESMSYSGRPVCSRRTGCDQGAIGSTRTTSVSAQRSCQPR